MNLITGGTGFLGGHVAALLLKSGQEVAIFKRKQSSLFELQLIFQYHFGNQADAYLKKIVFREGDLCDEASLDVATENVTNVYHCAAMVSFQPKDRQTMFETTVTGTELLVNVLLRKNIRRFCHVSSIAATGRSNSNDLIDEESYWEKNSYSTAYSEAKYKSELEVWRGIAEGLPAVIVMPGVIIGPGDPAKGTCQLFTLVNNGLKFYTCGVNGYVDVEDVAKCMIQLVNSDITAQRFMLVSENISYRTLLSTIARYLRKKPPSIHASVSIRKAIIAFDMLRSVLTGKKRVFSNDFARVAGSILYYSSNKIQNTIQYKFQPIAHSIEKTAAFYKSYNYL